MKNLLKMSLLAFVIAGSVACKKESKDDTQDPEETNTPAATEEKVKGEWMMTELNQSGESKANGMTMGTHTTTGSNFGGSLIFNADKTYGGDLGYDAQIITSIMGMHTDTTNITIDGFLSNGTWKVDANNDLVVTTSDGETSTIDVISISSSKMVLHMKTEQNETTSGISVLTTSEVDFVLEK